MTAETAMRTRFSRFAAMATIAAVLSIPLAAGVNPAPAVASELRDVVNDEVVTSYDIQRRSAFLRLQRQGGDLQAKATDELIEDALKRGMIRQAGIRIPDSMVNKAYADFAGRNKLSVAQMTQILNQAGVTADHFKEFIRLQIGWGQTVQILARQQSQLMNEQDVVAKMLERGGAKPTSTEYILQQVIFLVPADKRGSQLKQRRDEATRMRSLVNGCEGTVQLATGLRDVTVRDLGRILELQLPEDWAPHVKGLQTGQTTKVRDTDRGVEFLVVCRARAVNDDRVAQLEFSTEALEEAGGDVGAKILKDLREKAKIQRR